MLRKFYNIFCKDIKPIIHIKVGHLLIYCRNFRSEFAIEFGDRILLTNVIISNSKVSDLRIVVSRISIKSEFQQ